MDYKEVLQNSGTAELQILLDGDINISGFSRIVDAVNFLYRYSLFQEVSDFISDEVEFDLVALNTAGLNVENRSDLAMVGAVLGEGSWATASLMSSSTKVYAASMRSGETRIGPSESIQSGLTDIEMVRVQYASPGFIVISGIATAIKSVFDGFSAILDLKDRGLNKQIREEQLTQLALQNYREMHELMEKYNISASEIETLKLVGSVRLFRLMEEAEANRVTSVKITQNKKVLEEV